MKLNVRLRLQHSAHSFANNALVIYQQDFDDVFGEGDRGGRRCAHGVTFVEMLCWNR